MRFKSVTGKYSFPEDVLTKKFPGFTVKPVSDWLYGLLYRQNRIAEATYSNPYSTLKDSFKNELQLTFRRSFPAKWADFIAEIFSDSQLTADFLGLCLQNFAKGGEAALLEKILSTSGSAWTVVKTDKTADAYAAGAYDLQERVPAALEAAAADALSSNSVLLRAWSYCYSTNPDYAKTVVECQNVLEELLRTEYEPGNSKPQLGKLIGNLKAAPQKLSFKGDSVPVTKSALLDLVGNFPAFRGMHTAGTGKVPTKEEAEYILHTTIYVWGLHQK